MLYKISHEPLTTYPIIENVSKYVTSYIGSQPTYLSYDEGIVQAVKLKRWIFGCYFNLLIFFITLIDTMQRDDNILCVAYV